jgi:ribose-phosphate pyrophosphokinase
MIKRVVTQTMPVAPLKIIALENCKELGDQVNNLIVDARQSKIASDKAEFTGDSLLVDQTFLASLGYDANTYLAKHECSRFSTGEAKGRIKSKIRGKDLYILVDIANYMLSYSINGQSHCMSPDDHFQDLKRVIAACSGHAYRVNVIMPLLYEGKQYKRDKLESLDCATSLQELVEMGVDNIITFDAHDPRVQNAIPILGFDNFFTSYHFIRKILRIVPQLKIDKEHLMIISPDGAGMNRAVYYANVLGVEMGMFHKRKRHSTNVEHDFSNITYDFLGSSVENKDVIIVDDRISSGKGLIEIAKELKKHNAKKIYIIATFGLFTQGFEYFDRSYKEGIFDLIFTSNLTYVFPELEQREYYHKVDISKYIALIIDTLNHDSSVNEILNPIDRIHELLTKRQKSSSFD